MDSLTPESLAEGRRLLAAVDAEAAPWVLTGEYLDCIEWLFAHAPALLDAADERNRLLLAGEPPTTGA